jgi:hypothetical protein
MKKYEKDFRQLKDLALMGGLASTSTGLFTGQKPGDVAAGMLGVGVAGAIANTSFDIVVGKRKRK